MSDLLDTPTEKSKKAGEMGSPGAPANTFQLDVDSVEKALNKNSFKSLSGRQKAAGLLVILLLLAAGGYGGYKWLGTTKSTGYSTATVTKTTITDSIEATGTLSAVKESAMGFKNDDTITAINVEPGDKVKKGQILAQQDPASLESSLQQAQSSVDQDQINVKTVTLGLETNRKSLERQQKLFDAGAVSQTDLDTAQDAYTKSELELATAKSKLVNDQAKMVEAQSDLAGATLLAPFDGIIGAVNGQVGQINGINSSSSTLLTILSEDLQLSALVNEADIGRIKVDQDVEFTTSTYTNKTFKGKVLRITPQASTVSSVQYYPVLISCIDPDHQLLSGMSVSANIIIARKTDVASVSMMAVSYAQSYIKSNPSSTATNSVPSANSGAQTNPKGTAAASSSGTTTEQTTSSVLVLQNNQPTVKTVVLGLNDGSNYEVISGLNEGDSVVIGANQTNSSASSSSSSSSSSSKSTKSQNQGGGGMGGPPPGGF